MKQLTVFTPTYNRKHTLPRLYESLIFQKDRDFFEWLIVDDGSTDGTDQLIEQYIREDKIDIRYLRKENGGKPSAYNVALDMVQTPLFFCVDSDDWLLPEAMAVIRSYAPRILQDGRISGFAGICTDKNGEPLENGSKKEFLSDTMRIRDKYKGKDKPEIMKTELLKHYRFPIFKGEKFITEAYVFDPLTKTFPILYTNKRLMGKEYLKDGLTDTATKIRIKNIQGTLTYYKQRIQVTESFLGKLKAKINYLRFQLHAGEKVKKYRYLLPVAKWIFNNDVQVIDE